MATPWDRASEGYVTEWVPRFVPYHLDLVNELMIEKGNRVLVTCSGPGAEVLAAARAVGAESGYVLSTEPDPEMSDICCEKVKAAGFENVDCKTADPAFTDGSPWHVILCAFGLWHMSDRGRVLAAWRESLSETGKVGVMTWGPPEEDDPFERFNRCLQHVEPDLTVPSPRILSERDSMAQMFEEAQLTMVRHTVVRHTLSFKSAESFVGALREAGTWSKVWEELGDERIGRVAARFYGLVGGPDAPLSWDPPATLAIACRPGAEVQIASRRSSVRVPAF